MALAATAFDPAVNVPICTGNTVIDGYIKAVSDGSDGLFVVWTDFRSGALDIYCQHVLASGLPDPAWPSNGQTICGAPLDQQGPNVIADGSGGAIIVWTDGRRQDPIDGTVYYSVYAQHVLANGDTDSHWPGDGLEISRGAYDAQGIVVASDGQGGAIVAWEETRNVSTIYHVYAQHVLAIGQFDYAWPLSGLLLSTASGNQDRVQILSDGAGGAVAIWDDSRGGSYAQHVLSTGVLDPNCPAAGAKASPSTGVRFCTDGAGGGIVGWAAQQGGAIGLYANHVLQSGIPDPAWPQGGSLIAVAPNYQDDMAMDSDGAGGAIVAWTGLRADTVNVYAHHVQASGEPDPQWPSGGLLVSTSTQPPNATRYPWTVLGPDGAGGAFVAWLDYRSGLSPDIYAQHVLSSGHLDWPPEGQAVTTAPGVQYYPALVGGSDGPRLAWLDLRNTPNPIGGRDIYFQAWNAPTFVGVSDEDAAPRSSTGLTPTPNPIRSSCEMSFDLPRTAPIRLRVFDLQGRLVATVIERTMPAGQHRVTWDRGAAPDGVYLARLDAAGLRSTQRIVLLH